MRRKLLTAKVIGQEKEHQVEESAYGQEEKVMTPEKNIAANKADGESREGNMEQAYEGTAALASHFKNGICPPQPPFAKAYNSVFLNMISTHLVLSRRK